MYIRELPQPAKWAVAGSYPTRWMVTYDSIAKVYWVELGGLVRREAS